VSATQKTSKFDSQSQLDTWDDFWADKALLNYKLTSIDTHNVKVGRIYEECTAKALNNLSQRFDLKYVHNKINGHGADFRTYGLMKAEIEVKNPQAKYELSSSSIEVDYLSRFNHSAVARSRNSIVITPWLIASQESHKKLQGVHIIETGISLNETSSQEEKDFVAAIIEAELTRVLLQLEIDLNNNQSEEGRMPLLVYEHELSGEVDYSSVYLHELSEWFLYNS
jgi:hypothetical protein